MQGFGQDVCGGTSLLIHFIEQLTPMGRGGRLRMRIYRRRCVGGFVGWAREGAAPRPDMNSKGRDLRLIEVIAIFIIFTLIHFVSPPGWETRFEAGFAVIAALYNAWVDRGRFSYALVGVALLLLTLSILDPPLVPTGPPPD